ncbi:MAG: ABC transporter substrate-binding protein [Nocardioidaceae bacterium]|nr:ABC transporter substrate-binding protein [Nocardioidaceae bacterium]
MNLSRSIAATSAAVVLALTVAACSSDSSSGTKGGSPAAGSLVTTTKAGTEPVDEITWALYRDPTSIDPITAGDYPELTVTSLMCESLFKQEPDGTVVPGLASGITFPSPTTAEIALKDGVTFADGSPMTADDVVFSIERNRDPKLGGYWGPVLNRIKTVTKKDDHTVEIQLTEPDYWLQNALSFMAGVVVKKAYVEAKGKDYGTPKGGEMCTGPYKLDSWRTGDVLSVVANDSYWGREAKPLVHKIDFKGIPDEATLTSALQTGEVDGSYLELPLSTLDQVTTGGTVDIYRGQSYTIDAFIVADTTRGLLEDVRVRQALSLAFDRQSYVSALYKGTATPARALGSPGTWGYERDVFEQAWNALPDPKADIAAAKKLIEEAGVTGKTLTLGMSNEINKLATEANAMKTAAEKIGLKVKLYSLSADSYSGFFLDPKVRAKVDGFFTTNFPTWADPGRLYSSFAVPGAEQDYGKYDNPEVVTLLQQARGEADSKKRADLVVQAQSILAKDLPWIPIVAPDTVLALNKKLTGATVTSQHYYAPWALDLGGVG